MTRNIDRVEVVVHNDFKRIKLVIEHTWFAINWSKLEIEMQTFSSQLDFQKIKLKIVKLFNNFWQFCLTWNQITFTLVQVFHRRLQVLKTEIMLQYVNKTREEIAKGTCVEDLKYRLFYCSNFSAIRFSFNNNFMRPFDKFWQYASMWTKLFNIFHIHSHVQTRDVWSRVYFVTSSCRNGKVVWNSFRLFSVLNIRLFRVMIIDVWKISG